MPVIAKEAHHEGWHIASMCRENKPEGWQPKDPIPYAARAQIQLLHRNEYPAGWTSTTARAIPETGERDFDNWQQAHEVMISEAKQLIDSLKK